LSRPRHDSRPAPKGKSSAGLTLKDSAPPTDRKGVLPEATVTDWNESPIPDPDPASFARIAALVHRHTGIRLAAGKEYFVAGRLGGLLRSLGCEGWGELCEQLEAREAGALTEELVPAVVVAETRFFRDRAPFRALRERFLPEALVAGACPSKFRVWSAGCSTGQEPYSIVLALWDVLEAAGLGLEVWATDICQPSLNRAAAGVYDPIELARGLGPEERRRFFEELPGGSARVKEEIRRLVHFERFNLAGHGQEPPGRDFDAVFCRNVAIYFDRPGRRQLYALLGEALRPGGHLVLGAAETPLPGLAGFAPVRFDRCLFYRKVGGERL